MFIDTAGPFKNATTRGAHYFTVFIDEKTKKGKAYLLKTKAANYEAYQDFLIFIGKTPSELCILRNNNAAEFGSERMTTLLREQGCKREWCNAYEHWITSRRGT